jgi:hypothetical protein
MKLASESWWLATRDFESTKLNPTAVDRPPRFRAGGPDHQENGELPTLF